MNRVLITGLGVASPVGIGVEPFWSSLMAGRSGIGPITHFDASNLPVRIGGEVDSLDARETNAIFPGSTGQRDRKILLGLHSAKQAVDDAALSPDLLYRANLHLAVGLEMLALEDLTPYAKASDITQALAEGVTSSMALNLQTPLDTLADILGQQWGLLGGRWVNCSACAAGSQVIGDAFHYLRDGGGEIALVGAADSMLNPLGLGGFSLLRVLAKDNDSPQTACRPFDANRSGAVLGEGSAFMVLETESSARARGAEAYAEVLGYGSSMDAYRASDPSPDGAGALLSMSKALTDANLTPSDIDAINAHGTGTSKNDEVETTAIKAVLGSRAREIPVHAVKSMTGHLIAASGAVEGVASALTLSRRRIPPTINLTTPDPQCDLDYVPEGSREFNGRTVMSNSFGFGGQNATLIFRRVES